MGEGGIIHERVDSVGGCVAIGHSANGMVQRHDSAAGGEDARPRRGGGIAIDLEAFAGKGKAEACGGLAAAGNQEGVRGGEELIERRVD